jgi:xanthine dehydrogenase iron-sulfur cluster and FAD-binding subunit A
VDDLIIAGDVGAGDVVELPGSGDAVLVKRVRLGQGGFILTVAPLGDSRPEAERLVTLTTRVRLRRHGHQRSLQA